MSYATLAPRVVVVSRRSELAELLDRHGTRGAAGYFLRQRGRSLDEVQARHDALEAALTEVSAAIPADWRRGAVDRADLPRFLFSPEDVVIAVGQDGLVANVAKYLNGQPVIGIDPEPDRNPGVLVTHPPDDTRELLHAHDAVQHRTMVQALSDDGQRLVALNEIYLGHPSHQTARYELTPPACNAEHQASSGLIVATGTGSTGWCRSTWLERHSRLVLPQPSEHRLLWFVREAWPSPTTSTEHTEGELTDTPLTVDIESDHLVAFGDGIEGDALPLTWGQTVTLNRAPQTLRLVA